MTTNPTPPFNKLAKPAQRALTNAGIKSLVELVQLTEGEVVQLHGVGKNALAILKAELKASGLAFRE